MPELITRDAPDSPQIFVYTVPAHASMTLLAAGCNYDGSNLNAPFIPTLQIEPPNGWQAFLFGQDLKAATHDIVYVTFGVGLQPPAAATASGVYYTQTGLTQLELAAGWTIAFYMRELNGNGASAGSLVDSMALYVEPGPGTSARQLLNPVLVVQR